MEIPSLRLQEYVERLLEAHQCAVESDGERLHVVLSSEVTDALKTSEPSLDKSGEAPYRTFYFTRQDNDGEGMRVVYGGSVLKGLTQLMEHKGLLAAYAYEAVHINKANVEAQMHQMFQWIKKNPYGKGRMRVCTAIFWRITGTKLFLMIDEKAWCLLVFQSKRAWRPRSL